MVDWAKFTAALTARGTSFDKVRHASNRAAVLQAMGFHDALDIAVLETEWQLRSQPTASSTAMATATAAASPRPAVAQLPGGKIALQAVDAASLKSAPEELQEAVVADELLYVLRGHGGTLITISADGRSTVSHYVPVSMASLVSPLLEVTWSQRVLRNVEKLELINHPGRSKVKNAVAEAVREVQTQYTKDVSALAERCRGASLPLARIVAEASILCHPVRRLATIFEDIATRQRRSIEEMGGDVLLAELHESYLRVAGNADDEQLIGYVLRRAARPYVVMLDMWMYRGQLDDPFNEFFVSVAERPPKPGDGLATFMDSFITVKRRVPRFLESVYKHAFHAGRFCLLVRESGGVLPVADPAVSNFTWGDTDAVEAAVRYVYEASSKEVMNVLVAKSKLVERFASLKDYFLHARGDWLENFLEAAKEMLSRTTGQVKTYTLNVVLQSEIAKMCSHDPYHSAIRFSLSEYSLTDLVRRIREADPEMRQVVSTTESVRHSVRRSVHMAGPAAATRQDQRQIVDQMQLQVDADWLLSLIINPPFVVKLNLIFRLLLWCKLCERDLNETWWRMADGFPRATLLRLKLLQFVRQYFFYAVHQVLDPAWHAMMTQVKEATGIRELSASVSNFCDESFRGLGIKNEHAFRALSSILGLCQRFSELGHRAADALRPAINAKLAQYDGDFSALLQALGDPTKRDYAKLVPLLSWLDFSGYYERLGVYHIRVGAAAHDEATQRAMPSGRRSASADDETIDGRASSTA